MEEEYSNEKLSKNQIIALIIMGLILIGVFVLRPDPYKEMDQIDQKQAEIRIQISNERRMRDHARSIEESRKKSEEDLNKISNKIDQWNWKNLLPTNKK